MKQSGMAGPRLAAARGCESAVGGYMLVELMLTMIVLLIGLGAAVSSLRQTTSLGETNRERALALDAAESVVAMIEGEVFSEAFASFNANLLDDPVFAPGNSFSVRGLTPRANDPDGMVGEVFFPGNGFQLREDFVDRELGMPRDLNGDGAIDTLTHAADYKILPVRVRVVWRGVQGNDQTLEIVTQLVRD